MQPQPTAHGARSTRSARPKEATIAQRLSRLWRSRSSLRSPEVGWERRVETLEARVEHLEAELEGLQDAVYRQAVLEEEHIDELRRRTAPEQLARDLSEDTRRRGL
jgi:predicted RNase H-like nuclease (RuvC/YqgF family)